jgi:hypothetical protein
VHREWTTGGTFAKFLQEYMIATLYTMHGSLGQNGVVERRKETINGHGKKYEE